MYNKHTDNIPPPRFVLCGFVSDSPRFFETSSQSIPIGRVVVCFELHFFLSVLAHFTLALAL
eukprot:m.385876 g.385876  ORF g.385876 m.385876 type:complete len:62 (-) comp141193_c0_seq1:7-192(-)